MLGEDGPVARTTGSTVALAAHSRTVLLLDALAPGVKAPVVHVRSSGGSVGAVLNDSWLDGRRRCGSDDVVAALPPAKRVLVPGVRVQGAGALVRVAVPGAAEAVVQVRVIGEKGDVDLGDAGVVRVAAGIVARRRPVGACRPGRTPCRWSRTSRCWPARWCRTAQTAAGGDLAWSASSRRGELADRRGNAVPDSAAWHDRPACSPPRTRPASVELSFVAAGRQHDDHARWTSPRAPPGSCRSAGETRVAAARARAADRWWPRVEVRVQLPSGLLVSAGPLRQVSLTRVPADIAAAAD